MYINDKNIKEKQFGFSLIELIFVASIMSVVSLGAGTLIVHMTRELKKIDNKMSVNDTKVLLQTVFSNPQFCQCFFDSKTFNYTTKVWDSVPNSIPTAYTPTCTTVGAALISQDSPLPGTNLTVGEFSLDEINETIVGSGVFSSKLLISLNMQGSSSVQNPISIPLNFKIKMTPPELVSARILDSCSSTSIASKTEIIEPQSGYDNLSGTAACRLIGKECSYVTSQQFIFEDANCDTRGTHCMHVCLTIYNMSLPGVENGVDKSNVHSCNAMVGTHVTYMHTNVVQCRGLFSAICN